MLPSFNEWGSGPAALPADWATGFGSVGLSPSDQSLGFVGER
jgi:hypothetical protein